MAVFLRHRYQCGSLGCTTDAARVTVDRLEGIVPIFLGLYLLALSEFGVVTRLIDKALISTLTRFIIYIIRQRVWLCQQFCRLLAATGKDLSGLMLLGSAIEGLLPAWCTGRPHI